MNLYVQCTFSSYGHKIMCLHICISWRESQINHCTVNVAHSDIFQCRETVFMLVNNKMHITK